MIYSSLFIKEIRLIYIIIIVIDIKITRKLPDILQKTLKVFNI